jgi:hypothetical protein
MSPAISAPRSRLSKASPAARPGKADGLPGFLGPALLPGPESDDDPGGDPAPVCGRCGGDLGIFLKFGLDWRHYRGGGLDSLEIYDPGHAPEITWRAPASLLP